MNLAEKARIAREEAEKEEKLEKEKQKKAELDAKKKKEKAEQEAREAKEKADREAKEAQERAERERQLQKEKEEKDRQNAIDLEIIRPQLKKIAKAKVGKVITFGKFMQKKKDDPIEWIVIKNVAGEMTLLSKYVLDCMPWTIIEKFDKDFDYKNATVREFLNNEFYNSAFSYPEKKAIKLMSVDSTRTDIREVITWTINFEKNKVVNTTEDYVYLLSEMEAEQLKTKFLDTKPTKYAESKYYNYKWLLRDSSISKSIANYKSYNQREVINFDAMYYDMNEKNFKQYRNKIRIGSDGIYGYDECNNPKFGPLNEVELKRYGIRPVITIKTDI